MRRLAVLLAVALAFPASADGWAKASQGWAKISQGGGGSYATMPSPTGCTSGMVPYFNSSLQLVCSPTVYAPATDTTTSTGTVAARNVTATALATPVITPPVSPVLSLLTTVTVVAGASLADGDYFTLSDGSAVVYEFDNDATVTPGRVGITFVGTETAQEIRDLVIIAINGSPLAATAIAAAADTLTVTSDTAGDTMGVNSENVADAGFLVPAWSEPTHATTYGYKVEACLADGSCAPSAEVQTTTGHATLNNANYNSVTWGAVTGAAYYKLYRVTGTPSGGDAPPRLLYTGTSLTFSDTNATSTSEAVATVNETGITTTGRVLVRDGSAAAPSVAFASDPTTGFFLGGGAVSYSVVGVLKQTWASNAFYAYDNNFALIARGGSDAIISFPDTATTRIGGASSAAPVANTLIIGESGSGTNIAGANGVIRAGAPTGNASGSRLILQSYVPGVSGDTEQLPTTTVTVQKDFVEFVASIYPEANDTRKSGGPTVAWQEHFVTRATLGSKLTVITDNVATPFASVSISDGSSYSGEIIYSVKSAKGTAIQVLAGRARFVATREGSTYTVAVNEVGTQAVAAAAGTLTGAISIAGAAGAITFSATFDTSQSSPDVMAIFFRFDSTDAAMAITPL